MRVLVTRPEADSRALVDELAARGHAAAMAPLLNIRVRTDAKVDLTGVRTLLVTSANGVRAFAQLSDARDPRVLAVGEASAEAARAAGFDRVESADGDADALARLAIARLDPAEGALYHAAGTVSAGRMKATLEAAGFDVRRVPLYEAVPAERLPETARDALADGRIDAVLFFSPRTAKVFVRLTYDDELADACGGIEAVCLSRAVAEAVQDLPWRGVRVAEHPDRASLLAALDEVPPSAAPADRSRTATPARAATKGAMTQDPNDPKPGADADGGRSGDTGTPGTGANAALAVIQRFGGIRPMAHKLGLAVSTVQGWKNRGAIPESRHDEILEAARRNDIDLDRGLLHASGDDSEAAAKAGSAASTADEHAVAAEAEAAGTADAAREAAAHEHAMGAEAEASSWSAVHGRRDEEVETIGDVQAGGDVGASAPPPATAAPGGGGWLPGMFLGAAILVAGVGAAIGTRDSWLPYVDEQFKLTGGGGQPAVTAPPSAELDTLETTVADLSGQVASLEDRLAKVSAQVADAGAGQALSQLRGRVGEVEATLADATSRMNTLAGRMENASGRMESAVQRIDSLTARVENLGGRLQEVAGNAASAATAEELTRRLDQVEDQVAAIGDLQARIEDQTEVKETARAAAAGVAAKTLAVAELRDALRFSAPFQEQLAAARGVVSDDSALADSLDALAPLAAEGVPTRAELANAFDRAARQAVAAAQGASRDGMLGGVLRRLNDVVTVRKVGADAEGDDANSVLARAESKLEAGDLRAAVATVEGLPDPARGEMTGWLSQARNRLAAERALSELSADLMRQLSQAGGTALAADGQSSAGSTNGGGSE